MKLQKVSQSMSSCAGISFVHEEFNKCGLSDLIDIIWRKGIIPVISMENCSGRGSRYSLIERSV